MSDNRKLYKASFTSVVTSNDVTTDKKIGGSASFILDQNDLPVKFISSENIRKSGVSRIKCKVIVPFASYEVDQILHLEKDIFAILSGANYVERINVLHGMDKNKVRSKIVAYANLKRSKMFMAFYSISFPIGMSDDLIRKVHNTVLTRLRKSNGKFSYIWIAERQKNGTLHFHMLTNTFFNIRIINYFYAKAIHNILIKSDLGTVKFDYKLYNGCDVKRVYSVQKLTKYLTKYVTKNNEKMDGLLWNCDKTVSALVTHLYLNEKEFQSIYSKLIYMFSVSKETSFEGCFMDFDVYNYGSYKPKIIFENLNIINEFITRQF